MTDTVLEFNAWQPGYEALVQRVGLVDLGARTLIELTGKDRAAFLHNLCTNEVRKLSAGQGCEAFLTTVQGKTLGHVFIWIGSESTVLDTVPGQSDTLLKHLDHYLVCEQVELADRSEAWHELLLAGPDSAALLSRLGAAPVPAGRLTHVQTELAGKPASIRRTDIAGPESYLISVSTGDVETVRAALLAGSAEPVEMAAFEAARIEQGFPLFGPDMSDKNLPQELARDPLAISFVKGCYLGQETVARIDALGHVNKTLVGLRFDGFEIPPLGAELTVDNQVVGQVTSATYSPKLAVPLALGFVKRGPNAIGSRLESKFGPVEVVALPLK